MSNDALVRRISNVLRQLRILAEGKTSSYETKTTMGKGEDKPPPPVDSLYHDYLEKFRAAAEKPLLLNLLCHVAEDELQRHRAGEPDAALQEIEELRSQGKRVSELWAERKIKREEGLILNHAEGLAPHDVAEAMGVKPGWVKDVRRKSRRNTHDGTQIDHWFFWDDEKRQTEIRRLRATGHGKVKAAEVVGVTRSAIEKYWLAA